MSRQPLEILGWVLVMFVVIGVSILSWVVNDYWQYNIMPKYANDWGFTFFKIFFIFIVAAMVSAAILRFIFSFIGGIANIGFSGVTSNIASGSQTMTVPGGGLITLLLTIFIFAALLPLTNFIANNIPLVGYFSIIAFMASTAMQRLMENI
jgi:hypothetical protein